MLQQLENLEGQTGNISTVSEFYGRQDIQVLIFDDGRFAALQAYDTGAVNVCTGTSVLAQRVMTVDQFNQLFFEEYPENPAELYAGYIPGFLQLDEFKAVEFTEELLAETVLNGPVKIDVDLAEVQIYNSQF